MTFLLSKKMGCLAALAAVMLFSSSAASLPKSYDVLFVSNDDKASEQEVVLYNQIADIYTEAGLDSEAIHLVTVGEINAMERDDFAQYDFVVWSYKAGALSRKTTDTVLSVELPILLFDSPYFQYSRQLGLIRSSAHSRTHYSGIVRIDDVSNGMYHPAVAELMHTCMYYYKNLGDEECADYAQACFTADVEADDVGSLVPAPYFSLNTSDLGEYTRPLFLADDGDMSSDDRAVIFVNDKKHVIVSGTTTLPKNSDWFSIVQHDPELKTVVRRGSVLHKFLRYVSAFDTDLGSLGGWVRLPGADKELLFSPSGDAIVRHTDMVVPSRGFDFEVTRTYRSGVNNPDSLLGPGWTLNHERELIWDTFSDSVTVSDGAGGTQIYELVHGLKGGPSGSPADKRTFVSVMGGDTAFVTYYPKGNQDDVTRYDTVLDGPCTGRIHSNRPDSDDPHQEGFLVRDQNGNLAFFAPHVIANDNVDNWCAGPLPELLGRKDFRVRGGELKIFKLAYVEDRNGNRQKYFYDLHGERPHYNDPYQVDWALKDQTEQQLSCVVDTEGRGYEFDVTWKADGYADPARGPVYIKRNPMPCAKPPVICFQKPTTSIRPWLNEIRSSHSYAVEYGFPWYFNIALSGMALGTVHRKNLDGEKTIQFRYAYLMPPMPKTDAGWIPYAPVLRNSKNYDGGDYQFAYQSSTGNKCPSKTSAWFENSGDLEASQRGVYPCDAWEQRLHKPKLASIVDSTGAVTSFKYTEATRWAPLPEQQEKVFGWVSIEQNRVIDSIAYNRLYQPIRYHRSHRSGREMQPGYDYPACSSSYPNFCDAPTWHYRYNLDGQMTEMVSPSGLTTRYEHIYDSVLSRENYQGTRGPSQSIYAWLLGKWRNHWPQRQYWNNIERETRTAGEECDTLGSHLGTGTRFVYEPVFNQVVEEWKLYDTCALKTQTVERQVQKPYIHCFPPVGQPDVPFPPVGQPDVPQSPIGDIYGPSLDGAIDFSRPSSTYYGGYSPPTLPSTRLPGSGLPPIGGPVTKPVIEAPEGDYPLDELSAEERRKLEAADNCKYETRAETVTEEVKVIGPKSSEKLVRSNGYDHLERGGALTRERFLELTYLDHASGDVAIPSTFDLPSDLCNGHAGSSDVPEGNLICEVLPATKAVGSVPGRERAVALYDYDDWGRQTYSKDFTGREITQEYGCIENPGDSAFSLCSKTRTDQHNAVLTLRHGFGDGASTIDTWYEYDERGHNVLKALPVGDGSYVLTAYERNDHGWLEELTVSLGSDSGGAFSADHIERQEIYTRDNWGNVTRVETERLCDEATCTRSNDAGDTLTKLLRYDDEGRKILECREVGSEDSVSSAGLTMTCASTEYGPDGLIVSEKNYEGCRVEDLDFNLKYDGFPAGCVLANESYKIYDGNRRLLRKRLSADGADDRVYEYRYDLDGRTIAETNPDSDGDGQDEMVVYEYDALGRLQTKVEDGITTESTRDEFGNVVGESRTGLSVIAATCNKKVGVLGLPIKVPCTEMAFEQLGETHLFYDTRDVLVAAEELQFTIGDDPDSGESRMTSFEYDNAGRLLRTTMDYGNQEIAEVRRYDAFGRLEQIVNGAGGTEASMFLDNFGRVVEKTVTHLPTGSGGSQTTSVAFAYNAADQVIKTAVAGAAAEDCLLSDEYSTADCHVTYDVYDGYGFLERHIDAEGQVTSYARDGLGNPVALYEEGVYGPGQDIVTTARFDGFGNLVDRWDANNNNTHFDYNGFGELVRTVRANGYTKTLTLNGDGAVVGLEHAMNSALLADLTMSLDAYNRPLQVAVDGKLAQEYQYNGLGNITLARDYNLGLADRVDDSEVVVARSWDSLGNMLSDNVDGREVTAWFERDRLTGYRTPQINETKVSYNAVAAGAMPTNLPTRVVASSDRGSDLTTEYEWQGGRLVRRLVSTNGLKEEMNEVYDGFGNRRALRHISPQGLRSAFGYEYNHNDRLLAERSRYTTNFGSARYDLDPLDRVVGYEDGNVSLDYELDAANNIEKAVRKDGSGGEDVFGLTGDGLNAVASIQRHGKDAPDTFDYDERGNLVFSERWSDGERTRQNYEWDSLGRLIAFKLEEEGDESDFARTAFYKYDAFGRRVEKQITEVTENTDAGSGSASKTSTSVNIAYTLYGDDVFVETHDDLEDDDNDRRIAIHHDPTAVDSYLRIDLFKRSGSAWVEAKTFRPITDIRNNVIGAVSSTGQLKYKVEYDLHGNASRYCEKKGNGAREPWTCASTIEKLGADKIAFETAFTCRFSGRRYDPETGNYYYRTRYYAPEMGRFISIDSIGIWGDLNNYGNGYAYVGNMANSLLDPNGKQSNFEIVVKSTAPNPVDVYNSAVMSQGQKGLDTVVQHTTTRSAEIETVSQLFDDPNAVKSQEDYEAQVAERAEGHREGIDTELSTTGRIANALERAGKKFLDWLKNVFGDDEPSPSEEPDAPDTPDPEEEAPDENDAEESTGGTSSTLNTIDDERPDPSTLKEMLRSGRIKPKDGDDKDRITPEYENWESLLWQLRFNAKAEKKERGFDINDDGRIRLKPGVHAPHINYNDRMKIYNPGWIDPVDR